MEQETAVNGNTEEVMELQVMEVSALEAQDRAVVDIQITTAKRYPRNVTRAIDSAIAIVTTSEEIAKTCHYAVPRGGSGTITGPSVHLARILAQNWGNMRIEARVIAVEQKVVVSQAVAFDLETNMAVKIEVRRSIMTKKGRMSDDMIVVTGNAANAIAYRNAVYNVIPKGVVDKVYKEALKKMTGDVSTEAQLIARRKYVVDGLKDAYGVTEQEILKAVGRQAITHIDKDDLATLIGIGTAIKDGDTTVDEAFRGKKGNTEIVADDILPKKEEQPPAADPAKKPLTEELKEKIRAIESHEQFVTYVNGLSHLHKNKEFVDLVKTIDSEFKIRSKEKLKFA